MRHPGIIAISALFNFAHFRKVNELDQVETGQLPDTPLNAQRPQAK